MKREIDMREISDGKLYGPNDLVKADCGDCHGCFACCQKNGTINCIGSPSIFID